MRRLWLPLLVAGALLAGACRQSELTFDTAAPDPGRDRPPAPSGELVTDPDEVVALALDDLVDYWGETLPEVYGVDFTPLRGGLIPYGPGTEMPRCGPEPLTYDEIRENALYCPSEDLIAWDRVNLIPDLQRRFGSLTTGLVMAHEFAHAIQSRADVEGRTLTLELQADCFAGAWLADVDDRIATFSSDGDALELALAGLLELRDTVGVSARDPNAHGSGFDRIGAFLDGVVDGPEQCATYEADPPTAVAIPFTSANDAIQGGNLPLGQLIEPLVADLESYFGALVRARGGSWDPLDDLVLFDPQTDEVRCGDETFEPDELVLAAFYCVPDDTAYLDVVGLVPALDDIGDFAFGGELARLYALSAQHRLGILDDDADGLHADCLTGTYAAAEFGRTIDDQQLLLSPGDLDEIIISFLALTSADDVTAFDRTAAFRTGFLEGAPACDDGYL